MEAEGPTVLVVDDRPRSRTQIAKRFAELGFRVVEAEDGADGIRAFREEQPHAVVTDMRMPETDGMALVEALRRESPHTPVFCLTAWPQWEASAAAIKSGAREYLKWPRDLDRLVERVEEALRSLEAIRAGSHMLKSRRRRDELTALMVSEGGNVTRVAEKLGRSRKTVYDWCRRYGIRIRG